MVDKPGRPSVTEQELCYVRRRILDTPPGLPRPHPNSFLTIVSVIQQKTFHED